MLLDERTGRTYISLEAVVFYLVLVELSDEFKTDLRVGYRKNPA